MTDDIYVNTILQRRIVLKPEYLNKGYEENIEKILRDNIGNRCIKEGYVDGNSIKIMKRTIGEIINSDFTGNIVYYIVYSANICNPVNGNIISCKIIKINKLGIQAEEGPLSIIVAKQYHEDKDIFKDLKVGDDITIHVIGKRFSLNDTKIEIVGKLTTDKERKKKIKIKKSINIEPKIEELDEEKPVDLIENIEKEKKL